MLSGDLLGFEKFKAGSVAFAHIGRIKCGSLFKNVFKGIGIGDFIVFNKAKIVEHNRNGGFVNRGNFKVNFRNGAVEIAQQHGVDAVPAGNESGFFRGFNRLFDAVYYDGH